MPWLNNLEMWKAVTSLYQLLYCSWAKGNNHVRSLSNLLTAITSRVATLISASSKVHVTIEYHVMYLVFCMYSTLYSVQYGEILLS